MNSKAKDCLECRLISGLGLIGIGAYIFYQAKHRKRWENYTMKVVSCVSFLLGSVRLISPSVLETSEDIKK